MERYRYQDIVNPSTPPPYKFDGVILRSFILKAKFANLQGICKEYLNSVATENRKGFLWIPLSTMNGVGLVMLQIVTYKRMSNLQRPDLGYVSQSECIFSIPILQEHPKGIPVAIATFTPYCFVDDGWSMVSGREVLGYPKTEGWFQIPADPRATGIKVEADVMPTLGKQSKLERQPVVEIDSADEQVVAQPAPAPATASGQELSWPFGPVNDLYRYGSHKVASNILPLLDRHAGKSQPIVTLKQFRDATEVDSACYQAINHFSINLTRFEDGGALPKAQVHLPDYASLKIAQSLGMETTVTPIWAHWFKANFNLLDVNTICSTHPYNKTTPLQPAAGYGDLFNEIQSLYFQMASNYVDLSRQFLESWLQPPSDSE